MAAEVASPRVPKQARSRARVERILQACVELIVETGLDGVRMTEVAERAGVPVGSVYQYFPDKPAIVRALAQRIMTEVGQQVAQAYGAVATPADFVAATDALIQWFYDSTLAEPANRDIQLALQADRGLQQLDLEDTVALSQVVWQAGSSFVSADRREDFAATALLIVHLTASAVRLAVVLPPAEGAALVREHRNLVRTRIEQWFNSDAGAAIAAGE